MSEKLKQMVDQNLFVRIGVAAIDQRTQDLNGMNELIALYAAMNWIDKNEATEILAYAKQELGQQELV